MCVCSRALDSAHYQSDVVLLLGPICETFRYIKRQAELFIAAAALSTIGEDAHLPYHFSFYHYNNYCYCYYHYLILL
jgi:hypothetical protein